jgi:hypothetical protein
MRSDLMGTADPPTIQRRAGSTQGIFRPTARQLNINRNSLWKLEVSTSVWRGGNVLRTCCRHNYHNISYTVRVSEIKQKRRLCLFVVGRRTIVPKKYYAVTNCRLALEILCCLYVNPYTSTIKMVGRRRRSRVRVGVIA